MSTGASQAFQQAVRRIAIPDPAHFAAARAHLDSLTKPLGSLGRLEDFAAQLVALRGGDSSTPLKKAVYVFAADHGIVVAGVSAYPFGVTRQMVLNFLAGGAAVNVLARLHRAALHIVDVGVHGDFEQHPGLLSRKVRHGSRNMLHEPAMSHEELSRALEVGLTLADGAAANGETILAVGEMGIGNTTAASALTAALTGQPIELVTGRGTGLDDEALARKCRVIQAVLERHFPEQSFGHPFDLLRCLGGLEIAAMTGMILGAAGHGIAVVADGFISTVAAALALAFAPAVHSYLFAGHRSEEPGHRILLAHLGLHPILQLNMRLGEGTGAVLALPVLESALCLYHEMATFTSAAVDTAKGTA